MKISELRFLWQQHTIITLAIRLHYDTIEIVKVSHRAKIDRFSSYKVFDLAENNL